PEHHHRVRITRCGSFTGVFHQAPPPFILMAIFKKEAVIGLNQAKHGIQAPLFRRPLVPLTRLVAHDRPIPQAQKFPHVILRRCVTRFCRNKEFLKRLLSLLLIIKYEPFALFALNFRLNLRGSRTHKQAQPNPQHNSFHRPIPLARKLSDAAAVTEGLYRETCATAPGLVRFSAARPPGRGASCRSAPRLSMPRPPRVSSPID